MPRQKSKTVYLPHLNYRVRFRPFKKPPAHIATAKAWISRDSTNQCTIHLPKHENPSTLAHELVHVLYFICQDRKMVFSEEFEHMAYIMQHLMGQALGYEWGKD